MKEKKDLKNICICGVGGVGGYFGGQMAYKITQKNIKTINIYFLARGSHLEKIKQYGLILNTPEKKEIICKPTLATNHLRDIPLSDLYLICVKSYDLDNLIQILADYIRDDTILIPLLNGIDIYSRIRKNLHKGIVLPACVYIGSHIEKAGVVTQSGDPGFIYCGKDPKFPNLKPQKVIDFFDKMGITFNWNDDPYPAIWEKYILVASFALVTAYTNKTLGGVISDPNSLNLLKEIMKEIVMIAEMKKIKISDNIITKIINLSSNYPEVKTSYQRDLEKKLNKNEGDLFGGTIIRLGQNLGVPTPVTKKLYLSIQNRLIQ